MTTPMGTCCERCEKGESGYYTKCLKPSCECHTTQPTATQPTATQPTANMFQYRADPNEKKLDFTAPPTITRDALNNYIEQTAERNDRILERYLNGAPTPNTGTEWEREFEQNFVYRGVDLNLLRSIKVFVTEKFATQKSQLIAEVEAMSHEAIGVNGIRTRVVDVDAVITKLKGM